MSQKSKITELKLPMIEVLKISATKGLPEVGASSGTNSCTNVNVKG